MIWLYNQSDFDNEPGTTVFAGLFQILKKWNGSEIDPTVKHYPNLVVETLNILLFSYFID